MSRLLPMLLLAAGPTDSAKDFYSSREFPLTDAYIQRELVRSDEALDVLSESDGSHHVHLPGTRVHIITPRFLKRLIGLGLDVMHDDFVAGEISDISDSAIRRFLISLLRSVEVVSPDAQQLCEEILAYRREMHRWPDSADASSFSNIDALAELLDAGVISQQNDRLVVLRW